ncbi:MAG: SPOR domain-containing protein [Bacteroidota bacterium]
MDIAALIGELVLERECVIIPGLGAFITNYSPSEINRQQLSIQPPTKRLVFNSSLVSNDGLLAHYLAQKTAISYKTSLRLLELFVDYCHRDLADGKQIAFGHLGIMNKNSHQKLEFYPNFAVNYNEDTFGFKALTIKQVVRKPDYDLLAPVQKESVRPQESKVLKLNKITLRKIAAVLLPLAIITSAFFYLPSIVRNDNSNQSSVFSFLDNLNLNFGQTKNENIVDVQVEEPLIEISTEDNTIVEEKLSTEYPIDEKEFNSSDEIIVKEQSVSLPGKLYHVICGSFYEKNGADEMVSNLKEEGFDAYIAGQSNSGSYRVSMGAFAQMDDAENQMNWIRFHGFKNAWILKKEF